MQSIGGLFLFLDFDTFMSGQELYDLDEKPRMAQTNGYYPGHTPGDVSTRTYDDGSTSNSNHQAFQVGWSSVQPNFGQVFPGDNHQDLNASLPYDIPHSSGHNEDPQMWAWGSSSHRSPIVYENTLPLDTSSPASVNYSYEDATSSPPLSNDFSNVFEYDFSTSAPARLHGVEPKASSLPTSASRRRSPRPVRTPPSPDFKSREPSPTHSESNDPKRRFPCLILGCARRFTSQYTLKVHMEAHKPKPRVSFECTLGCSERFSRQHDRLRHEVAKHGKICEFLCDDCGRFFSTSKTLSNHKCPIAQGSTRWVNNSS